jgi:antitoxin (DNA-binding transcriptional repressor) of toxin-antitoxin stability system
MRTVTPLDLRRSLGAILDSASAGERILIERDHRPVAMLVSVEDGRKLEDDVEARMRRRRAALDRLTELGKRIRAEHPGGPSAVESVRLDRDRDG